VLVYNEDGKLWEDLSGSRIRSWNVMGTNGKSIDAEIELRDENALGS